MLNRIFESLKLVNDHRVIVNGKEYSAHVGKHEIWIPDLQVKVIWTWHGRIEALKDWDKGRNVNDLKFTKFNPIDGFFPSTIVSIIGEFELLSFLASVNMCPPINGFSYFKSVTSTIPLGVEVTDSSGCYGINMADAKKLPPGKYSYKKLEAEFLRTRKITASDGAKGDFQKHENIVNGYLVDVRRTIWDMAYISAFVGDGLWKKLVYKDSTIHDQIKSLTQFPHKERKSNYQTYYCRGKYYGGSRDTLKRFQFMNLNDTLRNATILDLGCNLGALSCEAYRQGALKVLGIDNGADYVTCARNLARVNGFHIDYQQMDLTKHGEVAEYCKRYFSGKTVDIVFALSLYKHIGNNLWNILAALPFRTCYVESHNAPEGMETNHVKDMIIGISTLSGVKATFLGILTDRSPRAIWKLEKK